MNIARLNFESLITLVISGITFIVGGIDSLFIYLLIAILIDYITGVLQAIYNKQLSSAIGIKGIVKKVGYILLVAIAVVADNILNASGSIRLLTISLLISCDGISILENLAKMNVPIPDKLKSVLEQIRKED